MQKKEVEFRHFFVGLGFLENGKARKNRLYEQHNRKERRFRQNGHRDFAELKAHYVGAHVEMCVLHS